jgi:hypothetical protein
MTTPELPVRICVGCGQSDDHPRHVVVDPQHGDELPWHMDCHSHVGCETCQASVSGSNGAQGHVLRQHIVTTAQGGAQ